MRRHLLSAAIAVLVAGQSFAQMRPSAEQVGSWVLTCPTAANCLLRHRSWLLPPPTAGGPSAALEVVWRGGRAVPVVAIRGLSVGAALGSVLLLQANAATKFDDAAEMDLPCAPDGGAMVCVPTGAAAVDAASELATSRIVLVRLRLHPGGGTPLPELSRSLELQQTSAALARFRATSPVGEAEPAIAGLDLRGIPRPSRPRCRVPRRAGGFVAKHRRLAWRQTVLTKAGRPQATERCRYAPATALLARVSPCA